MFIGNIVSAPLTKYYSDVALVCAGQTLIAIAVLGALFYSDVPWIALTSMALAAFGYFFIAGPMQALIIAGAGDAKVILAALGQIAYNGANAIGAFLGGRSNQTLRICKFQRPSGKRPELYFRHCLYQLIASISTPLKQKNPAKTGFFVEEKS